jgi:hypothetical protein
LKFYHIRSTLVKTADSNQITYAQSLTSNCGIIFSTLSITPVLQTIKSLTLFRGCPYISSNVFPNNPTLSTTQNISYQGYSDEVLVFIGDFRIGFFIAQTLTPSTASSGKLTLYSLFKGATIYIEKKDETIYAGLFYKAPVSFKDKKILYPSADQVIMDLSLASRFNVFASLMEDFFLYIKPFYSLTSDRELYFPVGTEYQNSSNEFSFSIYIDFSTTNKSLYLRVKPSGANYYASYYEINPRFYNQGLLSLLFTKNPTSNASIPLEIRNYLFTDGYVYTSDIQEGKKVYFFTSPSDVVFTTSVTSSTLFDIFDNSVIYLMSGLANVYFRLSGSSKTINYSIRNLRNSSSDGGLKILNGATIATESLARYDIFNKTNRTITT